MNINDRIDWKPGMELTAQTFLDMDANLDFRQQMAIRAALGEHCMGLLPDAPFNCSGSFYTNKFEITQFQCTALLPSGRILQADEPVSVTIPLLYGDIYYLTVGFGMGHTSFEKENVPYISPRYAYCIKSLEEVKEGDVLPIMRFVVKDGIFSVDQGFVPPCLLLSDNAAFKEFHHRYVESLRSLARHPNLREGDGQRSIQRYLFRMEAFDMRKKVSDFICFTQEIAYAVDYFIMTPNTEQPLEIPLPIEADVSRWLLWLDSYLNGAISVLDKVVLEDDSIDYEALLTQAKKELYDQLNPELYAKLLERIKDELHEELAKKLTTSLTAYMNETVKPEICRALGDELYQQLYDKLFSDLYEKLYNALYVPEEIEEDSLPII